MNPKVLSVAALLTAFLLASPARAAEEHKGSPVYKAQPC